MAPPVRPAKIIKQWVDAFNKADVETLASLYASDALNHQVVTAPVEGGEAIRAMLEAEFRQAEMVCIVENLEWRDPLGLRGCGFFHVVDGLIRFQRGFWDRLSFLRQQGLPIPAGDK